MLPSLVLDPPAGVDWIHEIKHDGYLTILLVDGGKAQAFTRNRFDWSDSYGPDCHRRREIAPRINLGEHVLAAPRAGSRRALGLAETRERNSPEGKKPGSNNILQGNG
jgi:ATP-dependent DNA ligase